MRLSGLLGLMALTVCAAEKLPPPAWNVPRLEHSPVVNGIIEASEWQEAALVTGFQTFIVYGEGFAPEQTWVWLGWSPEALLVGFRAPHRYREPILINVRGRDAAAYSDEAYELHLWPDDESRYYSVIIGLDSLYDARCGNPEWNAPGLEFATSQHNGFFDAELSIPWKALQMEPHAGMRLKAVLGHDSIQNGPFMSNWQSVGSQASYYRPDLAGILTLTDSDVAIRMLDWGKVNLGKAEPRMEFFNPSDEMCNIGYRISAGIEEYTGTGELRLAAGERSDLAIEWPVLRPELHTMTFEAWNSDTGKRLAQLAFPFTFSPKLTARVECLPSRNRLTVEANTDSLRAIAEPARLVATVGGIRREAVPGQALVFPISDIPVGDYEIQVCCLDRAGRELDRISLTWSKPDPAPSWLTNPVEAQMKVVAPFDSLRYANTTVSSILRDYDYREALVVSGIAVAGTAILAGPVYLDGILDGEKFHLSSAESDITTRSPAYAEISARTTLEKWRITVASRVEFDGMQWSRICLEPEQGASDIRDLRLVFPFIPAAATLMHWNNCMVSAPAWTGATPERWTGPFAPVLWLGNEKAGLCWFAQSCSGWRNSDSERMLSVERGTNETCFALNFGNITADRPAEFEFGFTATPTKPMPENWLGPVPSLDPWWDESNQFLHEAVPFEQWRLQAAECHRKDLRITKYTQTNYLSFYGDGSGKKDQACPGAHYFNTPEKKYWAAEWEMWPRRGLTSECNSLCANTPWRDLVVAGLRDRLGNSDFDGIYFDCSTPKCCSNRDHGCNAEYDLLGQRDIRRRLYNIFDTLNRTPLIWEHISDNMLGPVMNFATYHYDGEQYSSGIDDYRQRLTLERLRAFSIGTNWGHVPVFMAFCRDNERATESLIALWTLHMPVHFINGRLNDTGEEARKLDAEFGFDATTERFGYWENADRFRGQSDTLKVTAYEKADRMLLVVSNLSDDSTDARITFDSDYELERYLHNQSTAPSCRDGVFEISLKPVSAMIAILRKKE